MTRLARPYRRFRLISTGILCIAVVFPACGTGSGNRALGLASDSVGRAISGGGSKEEPASWSRKLARCGVFRDHRMACPPLRNCAAFLGTAETNLTVNVCVDDMGNLDPVKWCSYGRSWCRASAFPACDDAARWPCDDFEKVVCEDDEGRRRVLRSEVDPVAGACGYELAPLYEDPGGDAGVE